MLPEMGEDLIIEGRVVRALKSRHIRGLMVFVGKIRRNFLVSAAAVGRRANFLSVQMEESRYIVALVLVVKEKVEMIEEALVGIDSQRRPLVIIKPLQELTLVLM